MIAGLLDVARRFFELPLPRRARYLSADVRAPVRYGTSFNQAKDAVLFWRDFLKLASCQPLHAAVASWPDEPADLRYTLDLLLLPILARYWSISIQINCCRVC